MNEIAKAIYDQFGGNKAMAMIDGTAVYGEKSLTVHFKGCKAANCVSIELDGDDTYTVKFYKIGKMIYTFVESFSGIYADNLARVFEEKTGLYLSL